MIQIFSTGGTFEKLYFDAKSEFSFGASMAPSLLQEAGVTGEFQVTELMRKDSLEITEEDRAAIVEAIAAAGSDRIIVIHGTDTMADTARAACGEITGKTVIFTGAMQPARMKISDAPFNLGVAWGAVQGLPHGVYLAMNGQIFDPRTVVKNREAQRFELKP